jgi:hypothetical protein
MSKFYRIPVSGSGTSLLKTEFLFRKKMRMMRVKRTRRTMMQMMKKRERNGMKETR